MSDKFAPPSAETIAALDRSYRLVYAFRNIEHNMSSGQIAAFLVVARFPGETAAFYAGKLGTVQKIAEVTLEELMFVRFELIEVVVDPVSGQSKYILSVKGRTLVRAVEAIIARPAYREFRDRNEIIESRPQPPPCL